MATKSTAKAAPKKPARKKAASQKPPEPAVVEAFSLATGDAHAVLALDGAEFRLSKTQVALLRNEFGLAFIELH